MVPTNFVDPTPVAPTNPDAVPIPMRCRNTFQILKVITTLPVTWNILIDDTEQKETRFVDVPSVVMMVDVVADQPVVVPSDVNAEPATLVRTDPAVTIPTLVDVAVAAVSVSAIWADRLGAANEFDNEGQCLSQLRENTVVNLTPTVHKLCETATSFGTREEDPCRSKWTHAIFRVQTDPEILWRCTSRVPQKAKVITSNQCMWLCFGLLETNTTVEMYVA